MADVFVSYAREDRDTAERLSKQLETYGAVTWWDNNLDAGFIFSDVIETEIHAASCLIVLWSIHSVKSSFVIDEVVEAQRVKVPVIPIRIDGTLPPLGHRRVETIDFSGNSEVHWQAAFERLVRSINAHAPQIHLEKPPVLSEKSEEPNESAPGLSDVDNVARAGQTQRESSHGERVSADRAAPGDRLSTTIPRSELFAAAIFATAAISLSWWYFAWFPLSVAPSSPAGAITEVEKGMTREQLMRIQRALCLPEPVVNGNFGSDDASDTRRAIKLFNSLFGDKVSATNRIPNSSTLSALLRLEPCDASSFASVFEKLNYGTQATAVALRRTIKKRILSIGNSANPGGYKLSSEILTRAKKDTTSSSIGISPNTRQMIAELQRYLSMHRTDGVIDGFEARDSILKNPIPWLAVPNPEPKQHVIDCRLPGNNADPEKKFEVPETEYAQFSKCLIPKLSESYGSAGHWATSRWATGFRLISNRPHLSSTHGDRFVLIYVNRKGEKDYRSFDELKRATRGTIVAKPSFSINKDGTITAGPLFIMEKMRGGFNSSTADWRYALVLEGGKLFGLTGGKNSAGLKFCHDCHRGAERNDHLFFPPTDLRKHN